MAEAESRLIESLPGRDRLALISVCERVELGLADELSDPGMSMRHAYFPTEGFISLATRIGGSPGVEVGMIGSEGMLGAHFDLGVSTSALHELVQGAGFAWRISAAALKRALRGSVALRQVTIMC